MLDAERCEKRSRNLHIPKMAPDASMQMQSWHKTCVLVEGSNYNLSYHKKETIFFTIDPYYGNLC